MPNGFQAIPSTALYYATSGIPSAANNYNYAAIITSNYAVAGSAPAIVDLSSTQFGAVISSSNTLALGAATGTASTPATLLTIVNSANGGSFATGFFGAAGATSIGNGSIVNTGTIVNATTGFTESPGMLYLLGAITQTGAGLTNGGIPGSATNNAFVKTGTGTMALGATNTGSTFTGDLVIQGGTVMLYSGTSLSTGAASGLHRGHRHPQL